jgi:general secretion pathway protein A
MYEPHYGFDEKPFSLTPDPSFLYLGKKHRAALTMLQYGLLSNAGFSVVTGEIGSGKTTLIRQLLNEAQSDLTIGLISNTHRSFGELLQWVLMAFGLEYRGLEKVELYEAFVEFVINEYAQGRRTVLIIDEAQNLAPETLEELRMLSNVNADKSLVLQLVLVGQPELRETLQSPSLTQFAQRVLVAHHLEALSQSEAVEYIQHRLRVAGGDPDLFDAKACQLLWYYARGVPRVINALADISLVYGYAAQVDRISGDLVREVIRDRRQGGVFAVRDEPHASTDGAAVNGPAEPQEVPVAVGMESQSKPDS